MRTLLQILCFTALVLTCSSCEQDPQYEAELSFVVAGHIYGKAGDVSLGIHPPFLNVLSVIAAENHDHVFLTGDVVQQSNEEFWDAAIDDLAQLQSPYSISPGNHDLNNRELYESIFGRTYSHFYQKDDLFILLDSVVDRWEIVGEQLEWLTETLSNNASEQNSIFIFTHNMLWYEEDNQFSEAVPNWLEGRNPVLNYWSVVEPILDALPNDVYLFSGDFGANATSTPLKYRVEDNIHYVMSGMGFGEKDHYLVVKKEDNDVVIDVEWIGNASGSSAVLSDFIIP